MKKIIATTTVNHATEAIRKYDAMEDWELLVVADMTTPLDYKLKRGTVLWPDEYCNKYRKLVDLIGWHSVRLGRMVAFIEAYKRGADILASVDDDCIPMENWGQHIVVGSRVCVQEYGVEPEIVFDPFSPHESKHWHRGFPLGVNREFRDCPLGVIEPLVQEDLCYDQADYDAVCRLAGTKSFQCAPTGFYFCDAFSPINTQNTFIHRSAIRDFPANIPFIGRADDIWAGYIFQARHPRSTVYCTPSSIHKQERSIQSIVDDLEDEIFMYRNTYKFLQAIKNLGVDEAIENYLPINAIEAINIYRSYFDD